MSGSNKLSRSTRGVTATAAEANATLASNSLSAAEIAVLDGVTAGTATASKAVVLDASKGIATITSATITTATIPNFAGAETHAGAITAQSTLAVTGASTLTGGIAGGVPYNVRTWQPIAATSGTDSACTNGTAYCGSVFLGANATITGVEYLIGSVGGTDKVIVSLHDKTGALLANSALAGVTVGTAANTQQVPFTATYAAVGPAWYFVAVTFNGTTAKFRTVPAFCHGGVIGNSVTQTFGTAATFTAPTTFTADKVPVANLY